MITGIYLIENKINHHKYVGQAKDINKRWQTHLTRYKASNDKEYEKPLYRAFRKYGIENFIFTILEECSTQQLNEREIYWITTLDTLAENGNGYNIKTNLQPELPATGEAHPKHKLTKEDVIDIRTRYNNKERCKYVWQLYQNKVGWSGFSKVWKGETWKTVMMDVYTDENKQFHKNNTGQLGEENGRSILTADDVLSIRIRQKNGETMNSVFLDYKDRGITKGGMYDIWCGKNWKNIQVE